jgi:hypothetical protein
MRAIHIGPVTRRPGGVPERLLYRHLGRTESRQPFHDRFDLRLTLGDEDVICLEVEAVGARVGHVIAAYEQDLDASIFRPAVGRGSRRNDSGLQLLGRRRGGEGCQTEGATDGGQQKRMHLQSRSIAYAFSFGRGLRAA